MIVTDPIADMLTRVRNAITAKHPSVEMPTSKMLNSIAEILYKEGYIASYKVIEEEIQNKLVIELKYGSNGEKVITSLKRISKPGLKVYVKSDKVPKVLNGMGIAILSTSKGIMTDKEARTQHVGGEVLAFVW